MIKLQRFMRTSCHVTLLIDHERKKMEVNIPLRLQIESTSLDLKDYDLKKQI